MMSFFKIQVIYYETARTKIDVHKGTLSFDETIVTFNIFYVIKYLEDSESVFRADVIDHIIQDDYEHNFLKDELNFVL